MMALADEIKMVAHTRTTAVRETSVDGLIRKTPGLRELPSVQAAGTGSLAQYEVINAIVEAAVERLGPDDIGAAKALFGMTEATRGATWRVRQREAGATYHTSWETFRREPQNRLMERIAKEIRPAKYKFPAEPEVAALKPCPEFDQELIKYVHTARPDRARLLEYSCFTAKNILLALRDVGCHTRLLVAHPLSVHGGFQRRRIQTTLDDVFGVEFASCRSLLDVRFYSTPPSLRGRRFGERVTLGWYTYRDDKDLDIEDPRQILTWGHDNALVVADTRTEQGAWLALWFEREFDCLWEHRRTGSDPTSLPSVFEQSMTAPVTGHSRDRRGRSSRHSTRSHRRGR